MPAFHQRSSSALVSAMLISAACGCARTPVEHTVRKVAPEPDSTVQEQGPAMPADMATDNRERPTSDEPAPEHGSAREEFLGKLTEKIERFDAQLDALRTKVSQLGDAARIEWDRRLAEFEERRDALRAKIEEATKATEEMWDQAKHRTHAAWDELEKAFREAEAEL